ncbi:MAG: hypothetical protein ACK5FE_16450 [Cyanobacteriota bacterium]
MQHLGAELEGLETGNAWALRDQQTPHTNWLGGEHPALPAESLRLLRHRGPAGGGEEFRNLSVKWFLHDPADPPEWGQAKPLSQGRCLSLLTNPGGFELRFWRQGEQAEGEQAVGEQAVVVLEEPGDFALWGPGLAHSWRVLQPSVVLTVRWELGSQGDR